MGGESFLLGVYVGVFVLASIVVMRITAKLWLKARQLVKNKHEKINDHRTAEERRKAA